MAITCPHQTAQRTTPEGYAQHQCALVAQTTGMKSAWIGDNFSIACQGDDLTSSACAKVINSLLALRVRNWRQASAPAGCSGCLSLDQAFALIITRQSSAKATQVLLDAVKSGMPQPQAEALAAAHGLKLDAQITTQG